MSRILYRTTIVLTTISLIVILPGCPNVVAPKIHQLSDGTGITDKETVGVPPTIDSLDSVAIGDIIVGPGTNSEGLLRRVTDVQLDSEGNIIQIGSVQASITEALEVAGVKSATLDVRTRVFGDATAKGIGLDPPALRHAGCFIDFGGTVLGEGPGFRIEITEGCLAFDPEVILEVQFGFLSVDSVLVKVEGQLSGDFAVSATGGGPINVAPEPIQIGPIDPATGGVLPFETTFQATIGPLPVWGTVKMYVYVGIEASLNAEGTAEGGVNTTASLTLGAQYDGVNWTPLVDSDLDFGYIGPTFELEGEFYGRVYVLPRVEIWLYNVVGPWVEVEPFVDLSAQLNLTEIPWIIGAGLEARVGGSVTVLDYELIGIGPFQLLNSEDTWRLLASGIIVPSDLLCEAAVCDDGLFCNGTETCISGECFNGVIPCTPSQTCDELNDVCVAPPQCGDGICNENETCVTCSQDCDVCPPGDGNSGNLLVSSTLTHSVLEYDGTTGQFDRILVSSGSGGLSVPHGLAFAPDGSLLVAGRHTGGGPQAAVYKFDSDSGQFLGHFAMHTSLETPRGLLVTSSGKLLVANSEDQCNAILEFNASTGQFVRIFADCNDVGFNFHPRGLALGPDGNVYAAITNAVSNSQFLTFNGTSGAFLGACSDGLNFSGYGIVFSQQGGLLLANTITNQVERYDHQSCGYLGVFVVAGSGGLGSPRGLSVGPTGNLFVASETTDSVFEFSGSTGDFIREFVSPGSGGLDLPTFLLFRP